MRPLRHPSKLSGPCALSALLLACATSHAQQPTSTAQTIVLRAVHSELRAEKEDTTLWRYRDQDDAPGKASTYNAIETRQGELRRLIALNGQPLAPAAEQQESQRIEHFLHDPSAQARARRNGEHDDAQAEAFLKMLPDAFLWTVVREDAEQTTLHYVPNPTFQPPTLEARVLAAMEGEMVVTREGDRIRELRGSLSHDVTFGLGLLGRMDRGGTFFVERRQVGPGHWEIAETHVHIGGHALLFKNIGQNSDEVKTEWKPSTAATLADGARDLGIEGTPLRVATAQ